VVRAVVRVEVAAARGRVLLVITGPPSLDGAADSVALSLSGDEARELSNALGEMILAVSKPGVMA
jgi:hypothetical protein